ncbi:MAG: sigma-70 family RNA polymerase sigma factor [Rhodospirillales bacterium]|nr:sigma-70 family RNA polymerase sigma factor [Rhodospirillales bacterium]
MKISFKGNRSNAKRRSTSGLLDREREWELARRWKTLGDQRALDELVIAHERMVIAVAAKFRRYGPPMEDLVQEGCGALVRAASSFDPDRGFRFSTYSMWWVRAAIFDFVLGNKSVVKQVTSGAQRSLFFQLQRLRSDWRVDGKLTAEQRERAAVDLKVSVRAVEEMELFLGTLDVSAVSEHDFDDDGGAVILVAEQHTPEELAGEAQEQRQRKAWLREALGTLSEREQAVIAQRRLSETPKTLKDIGSRFGISAERVRQIENAAVSKLRGLALAAPLNMAGA